MRSGRPGGLRTVPRDGRSASDRKSTRLNSSHSQISHAVFCLQNKFALPTQGVQGGLLQMINHGLSTGTLFLLVGMIYERRHTRQIADFGGLQKVAPVLPDVFI